MNSKENTATQQKYVQMDLSHSTAHLIRIAHRSFQQALQSRLAVHGLKLSHWHCLRYLWEEDGLTQKELSRRVYVNESTIVTVIQEMESIGLIRRKRCPADRRRYSLSLTAKAKRITKKLLPVAGEVNKQGTLNMTNEETRQFNALAKDIIDNLKQSKVKNG